ncbi:GM12338 [Drosophila sechellia]|uniref:GM12338 n=1 Tax=Drosophila sechellia TaxID=7238 RepID=B4I103_DROSE|nr:GM12338 [Drosophila sechellia]
MPVVGFCAFVCKFRVIYFKARALHNFRQETYLPGTLAPATPIFQLAEKERQQEEQQEKEPEEEEVRQQFGIESSSAPWTASRFQLHHPPNIKGHSRPSGRRRKLWHILAKKDEQDAQKSRKTQCCVREYMPPLHVWQRGWIAEFRKLTPYYPP